MGLAHSPRVVTDGLVVSLDAANIKSYTGGNTINNTVSNTNFSMQFANTSFISYDTQSKSIFFNRAVAPASKNSGYAEIVTSGELTANNYLHNDHTTEIWFKSNDREGANTNLSSEINSALVVFVGFHALWIYSNTQYFYTIQGKTSGINNSYTLGIDDTSVNVWTQLVAVRENDVLRLYKDGNFQKSGTITAGKEGTPSSNTLRLAVGNRPSQLSFTWSANVNIAQVKMYKKALSNTEVQQNFNALRGRFGI